jgi:hypothetical protein
MKQNVPNIGKFLRSVKYLVAVNGFPKACTGIFDRFPAESRFKDVRKIPLQNTSASVIFIKLVSVQK